ncbi:MAG: anti-sigma factor domain-containing protein [Xanthobacteraceae bacterium]
MSRIVMMDQEKDALAAEYVLGTLGPDERAEAQALIAMDTRFAEIVRSWERRLGELSAMVDPVEPPADMWERIKAGVAVSERSGPEAASEVVEAPSVASTPISPPAETVSKAAGKAEPPAVEPSPEPIPVTPPESIPVAPAEPVTGPPPEPATVPPPQPPGATPRVLAAAAPAQPTPQSTAEPSRDDLRFQRPLRRWRTATALTGSLAACLAALLAVQLINPDLLPAPLQPKAKIVETTKTVEVPWPKPAEFVAVLQRDASSPAFLLTFDLDKRQLTVRTVGAERQAGKSYELWLVSDKFPAPRSLGVIGAGPYTVRQPEPEYDAVVINRATYAVSLEPEGGSPTGAPTGPVLYTGKLLQATAPDFPARTP